MTRRFKPFREAGHKVATEFRDLGPGDTNFYERLFLADITTDETIDASHSDVPSHVFARYDEQQVLIIRKSYKALRPFIEKRWGTGFTMVTGTPGIGKTYMGVWHLRELVLENPRSDRVYGYCFAGKLFVFTWDKQEKGVLELPQRLIGDGDFELWCGVLVASEIAVTGATSRLLQRKNGYVIADPRDKDISLAGEIHPGGNLVVYVSHGHPLIGSLRSKHPILDDHNRFVLPGWSEAEFRSHTRLLRLCSGGKKLSDVSEKELKERIRVAGKILRFLVASSREEVERRFESLISKVVKSRNWDKMEDVKGSLVSLDTPGYVFDESSNDRPTERGSDASETAEVDHEIPSDNCFAYKNAVLLHVSDFVIEQLEVKLKEFTADEIGLLADAWSTNGYMSVFGALFERHSHVALMSGKSLPLYALSPPPQRKSESIGMLVIPEANVPVYSLEGNNPDALEKMNLVEGSYVRPANSNFPTYDLYVVASGKSALPFIDQYHEGKGQGEKWAGNPDKEDDAPWKKLKFKENELVGLGLQCTVSGAGGVPIRPKHKVLHHIVRSSTTASKKAQKQIKSFLTIFVVPTICVKQFNYQVPVTSRNKEVDPKFRREQFVAALDTNYAKGFRKMIEKEARKTAAITVQGSQAKRADDDSG